MNMRLQKIDLKNTTVALFAPDDIINVPGQHSPYWAKVWPAAIGLCYFLENNLSYIQNKTVLELAAGLGLPSIYAASFAQQVLASDIEPNAIPFIRESASLNNLLNLDVAIIDWSQVKNIEMPEVVLLSDVNYNPLSFTALLATIHRFLNVGSTIILSTPQRLMAKTFVSQLLPFCIQQEEIIIERRIAVSVFVLNKK
jgi:predicted nicotinamide N-methyase